MRCNKMPSAYGLQNPVADQAQIKMVQSPCVSKSFSRSTDKACQCGVLHSVCGPQQSEHLLSHQKCHQQGNNVAGIKHETWMRCCFSP